jgi:hypothetical protein
MKKKKATTPAARILIAQTCYIALIPLASVFGAPMAQG